MKTLISASLNFKVCRCFPTFYERRRTYRFGMLAFFLEVCAGESDDEKAKRRTVNRFQWWLIRRSGDRICPNVFTSMWRISKIQIMAPTNRRSCSWSERSKTLLPNCWMHSELESLSSASCGSRMLSNGLEWSQMLSNRLEGFGSSSNL